MYISIVNRQVTCASITNCRSCYYKTTHTEAHTKDTFFLLTSQFARVQSKNIGSLEGGIYLESYKILRLRAIILESFTEKDSVFKDSPPCSCVYQFCVSFKLLISVVFICLQFHIRVLICLFLCHIIRNRSESPNQAILTN